MNDISTTVEGAPRFIMDAMASYQRKLEAVTSWDTFRREFLMGTGKSKHTTDAYLCACKQFLEFASGRDPFRTTKDVVPAGESFRIDPLSAGRPEVIDDFYDAIPTDNLDTKALKICALRFMYGRLAEIFPRDVFPNPFDIMTQELKAKLSRSKRNESERDALTEKEYRGILAMLKADKSLKAAQDYAFIRFAVTSGLRAAELVGLRWDNLSESEGVYKATFTGKGSKVRTVQLEPAAVRALRSAFRARFGRKPQGADYVLNGLPTGKTKGAGLTKSALHYRLKAIIAHAKRSGIVRANLLVSTHTLRHTCATRLVAAGVPLDAVQRHLGHSNLATTAVYLHNSVDLSTYWQTIAGEAA